MNRVRARFVAEQLREYLVANGETTTSIDIGVCPRTLDSLLSGNRKSNSDTLRKISERVAKLVEPRHDGGKVMAFCVRRWLDDNGYDVACGAMALQVSPVVLESILAGQLPHRNIITHLCAKIPALGRWSSVLLDQR